MIKPHLFKERISFPEKKVKKGEDENCAVMIGGLLNRGGWILKVGYEQKSPRKKRICM